MLSDMYVYRHGSIKHIQISIWTLTCWSLIPSISQLSAAIFLICILHPVS